MKYASGAAPPVPVNKGDDSNYIDITIVGHPCSGKTTVQMICANALQDAGFTVSCFDRGAGLSRKQQICICPKPVPERTCAVRIDTKLKK